MKVFLLFALLLAACATPTQTTYDTTPLTGELQLLVYGLSCPLCASNLYDELNAIPGVSNSWGNLDTGEVHVEVESGKSVSEQQLHRAVSDAGFTLKPLASR